MRTCQFNKKVERNKFISEEARHKVRPVTSTKISQQQMAKRFASAAKIICC